MNTRLNDYPEDYIPGITLVLKYKKGFFNLFLERQILFCSSESRIYISSNNNFLC